MTTSPVRGPEAQVDDVGVVGRGHRLGAMPQPGSRAAARPKSPHHRQLSGVTTRPRISRSGPSGSVTAVQKTAATVTGLCGPGSPAATRAATSDGRSQAAVGHRGQPPGWLMLTIQSMPNRSTHMPNSSPHICFSSGIVTVPPSDSFAK